MGRLPLAPHPEQRKEAIKRRARRGHVARIGAQLRRGHIHHSPRPRTARTELESFLLGCEPPRGAIHRMCADHIKTVPLAWDTLIQYLRKSSYDVSDYLYRGQGNPNWSLVPSLQRKLQRALTYPLRDRKLYTDEMYDYLRAFRDHAHGLVGFPDGLDTLNSLLTLGRHHGLVTPLLDWTRSPYIAAFFALAGHVARDANMPLDGDFDPAKGRGGPATVAIWRYQIRGDGSVGTELRIYTEVAFPNARQKAQSSVYMHLDTHEYQSVEELLIARDRDANLEKWIIDVPDVRVAIGDLALMNIHIGTMFPDLSHAAQHANNRKNYPETFF